MQEVLLEKLPLPFFSSSTSPTSRLKVESAFCSFISKDFFCERVIQLVVQTRLKFSHGKGQRKDVEGAGECGWGKQAAVRVGISSGSSDGWNSVLEDIPGL